jgi:hypothetical protein
MIVKRFREEEEEEGETKRLGQGGVIIRTLTIGKR